jgi:hypothetical protein
MAPTTPIGSRVISASALRGGRNLVVDLVDRFCRTSVMQRAAADATSTLQAVLDRLAHVQRSSSASSSSPPGIFFSEAQ